MSTRDEAIQDLRAKIEALQRYDLQRSFGDYWIAEDDKGEFLNRDEVLALFPPAPQIIDHGAPPLTTYKMPKKFWPKLKEKA